MYNGYWDTVESIAEEIIENYGTKEENWHDPVWENVDGNSYIIHSSENGTVLKETNNEPDPGEVNSLCKPDASWRDIRMMAAFCAMERDIYDKLREIRDKKEAEEDAEEEEPTRIDIRKSPACGWYICKFTTPELTYLHKDGVWRSKSEFDHKTGWHSSRDEAEKFLKEHQEKEQAGPMFCNHYFCDDCNRDWEMEWDCECDDKCPDCNTAYTPYHSDDITGQI